MKIIFNSYPVSFQCPGGGEIQLLKSKEALERRGHEVILFNQWTDLLKDADIIHHFSVQGGSLNLCGYVHTQGIPLVISPILWLSEYVDQYPMDEISQLLHIADAICPNSIAETRRFLNHFDTEKEKYIVTHNGIDEHFFEKVSEELFRSEFRVDGKFILCVGNIERRKNQLALIEAATQIGVQVILIGNIRDSEYYKEIVHKFSGNFKYLGFLAHDSDLLRSAYSACSVFALPSLLETPGLAALEAAASGANLVITSEGCTEEYFADIAEYVNPKDVFDIATKLLVALKKNNGKIHDHIKNFTWDRTASELETAYKYAISHSK